MRDTLSAAIENTIFGARVDAVRTFAEGIEHLERRPATEAVIIDLNLPDMPGLMALRAIAQLMRGGRLIVLSSEIGDDVVRGLRQCGVHGAFSKDIGVIDLSNNLLRVIKGETLFELPSTSDRLANLRKRHGLSSRETVVLRHHAQGADPGEIAQRLGVAETTVRNHLQRVYSKIGVRSAIEAYPVFSRLLRPQSVRLHLEASDA